MLLNFEWLQPGKVFPPATEVPRLERYVQNRGLFDGDHFADPQFRTMSGDSCQPVNIYAKCAERIARVVGNFDEVVSFPVLLNYQRLMSLKMADLVCGEYPTISGTSSEQNEQLQLARDRSDFDAKLYSTVLDISRYGDAIWRIYKDERGFYNFTCWDPRQWFPIVSQDGTYRITNHCLCWVENVSEDPLKLDLRLHVQVHSCDPKEYGYYWSYTYMLSSNGRSIGQLLHSERVPTGLKDCAIRHLKAFAVTGNVYGYDDYMPIDSLLSEIMVRVGQISAILDKHADPNITGPVSMLSVDPQTGEYKLNSGKFFAVSPGEEQPKYMTWDGQLTSAFKQLEFLINQLNILSEMGAALLGGQDGSSQAISGTAMRFKMVNPLAKARRIANSLTWNVRQLMSSLCECSIGFEDISVFWADGLPDDPRENIENCKLATGATQMMPLEKGIMEFFNRTNDEAVDWIQMIQEERQQVTGFGTQPENPNHPGPQDGTGVNPAKKGSTTGLNNFHGLNN